MEPKIARLPTAIVNRIAAGEVIDSLAAVVRELAENALDAGATRITIALSPSQWRLRVIDNGQGLSPADLLRAAAPHSTSKLSPPVDLGHITSLGFRGEALHSLAQLAELEIVSRPVAAATGWQVRYDAQGQPAEPLPAAIAPGTIVTVHHLFANWPARRQGLPPLAQQLRAVQALVQNLALCHPTVTWQVQQDDQDWFTSWPGKSARQVLPQFLRGVREADLQEITFPCGDLGELYLLLGLPDRCHRHRPDWVRVGVNGRMVQLPVLAQTLLTELRWAVPRDRFPVAVALLQVPPAQVDWNRHPAKSEVYLHHLDQWREHLAQAIAQALQLGQPTLTPRTYAGRVQQLLKTAEQEAGYTAGRTVAPAAAAPSDLRAIAQIHQMYILAEHPSGVWLIEQHIAHERVLYEQLCDRWELVPLPSPIVLQHLTPIQIEQLRRLDLDVEPFGQQSWVVRTAPALLAPRDDCQAALLELSQGGDLDTALVATACRSAIRNGTPLSLPEMQTLLDQWQRTRHPRTCPHGRPICLTLEESSLSRFFRRHWVIGKSHGI